MTIDCQHGRCRPLSFTPAAAAPLIDNKTFAPVPFPIDDHPIPPLSGVGGNSKVREYCDQVIT